MPNNLKTQQTAQVIPIRKTSKKTTAPLKDNILYFKRTDPKKPYLKNMSKFILLFLLAQSFMLVSCAEKEDLHQQAVKENDSKIEAQLIYGDDNRLENYQASAALQLLAASTVALVDASDLISNSAGQQVLSGENFGSAYNLCSSEPFRDQTSGAFCSGSLVGPDTIITAGHCITDANGCAKVRFVFDFALNQAGVERKSFSANDVYGCKQIIARDQQGAGPDYAVIKLDRPVVGRTPLKFRKDGVVKVGDDLVVIGHPAGLPQKIAGGAKVRSVQTGFFVANLDTYGGNSGSAVFNLSNGVIEGILVRGDNDFVSQGNCMVSNRCTDAGCRGEDVTRLDVLARLIPDSTGPVDPDPVLDEVFNSSAALAIPDSPKAGVKSSLAVNSAPKGRQVQVTVDLVHTYKGDLLIELLSPDGKVVILHNRSGGSLDNIKGTFGADLASAQSLAGLAQVTQSGNWSLRITDKASRDVGTLKSWSLIFKK